MWSLGFQKIDLETRRILDRKRRQRRNQLVPMSQRLSERLRHPRRVGSGIDKDSSRAGSIVTGDDRHSQRESLQDSRRHAVGDGSSQVHGGPAKQGHEGVVMQISGEHHVIFKLVPSEAALELVPSWTSAYDRKA